MKKLFRNKGLLFTLCIFTFLAVTATAKCSEANTIRCHMRGSVAGPVGGGKQLITFSANFKNVSRVQYISRIDWVKVRVHGYFRGREETYTRKVNVDWSFNPPLSPGRSKTLNIRFRRRVQPNRGSFPYDDVEVKVVNIHFFRAS